VDYVSVNQARAMPGLRLILHGGVPAPWSEAAKSVLKVKGVEFTPVLCDALGDKAAQKAWTGHENAPVAIYEDEPPRAGWAEILMLAERLKPEPALVPDDPAARADVMGLSTLICGEQGFGWMRRLVMLRDIATKGDAASSGEKAIFKLIDKYGYSDAESDSAAARTAAIVGHLAERLHAQKARGSDYLVGDGVTAADVYWACFVGLLDPLPEAVNPMPGLFRMFYTNTDPVIGAALDPILLAHRDMVYERHIGLPLDF
jgi:glutathione S-transferase